MNKRELIVATAALAAATAATAATGSPHSPRQAGTLRRPPPLDGVPRLAAWQHYLGDVFTLAGAGGALRLLRIAPATAPATTPADTALEQFTLVFTRPPGMPAGGATHRLRHASGQQFSLYLDAPAGETTLRAHFALLA